MTEQAAKLIEDLLIQCGSPTMHKEGAIFETEQCVCRSAAGFYVGSWCIESISGHWLPQPYARNSVYFPTFEQAERHL